MTSNNSQSAESWEARDLQSVLHGFTHLGTLKESGPVVMSRGEGIYVEDSHGKRYLEGNSLDEIANLLGTRKNTLEVRLLRARKKLGNLLKLRFTCCL